MYSVLDSGQPVPVAEIPHLLPFVEGCVRAGFPSPAEDFAVERIDIMAILIQHPQATFFMRLKGDSMINLGLFDGDVVVIDKAVRPRHNHIVVASVDGEFTCKRLWQRLGRIKLQAANPTFPDITPRDGQTIEVWGVVRGSIRLFPV